MKELLYAIVGFIAKIHSKILQLNDAYEYNFSDKELHFIVIGVLGMCILLCVYPFFKWLAKKNYIMLISWIYAFTLIVVITFAIEIGQKITRTGIMEFSDIVFGCVGFLMMFIAFSFIRMIWHLIINFFTKKTSAPPEGDE